MAKRRSIGVRVGSAGAAALLAYASTVWAIPRAMTDEELDEVTAKGSTGVNVDMTTVSQIFFQFDQGSQVGRISGSGNLTVQAADPSKVKMIQPASPTAPKAPTAPAAPKAPTAPTFPSAPKLSASPNVPGTPATPITGNLPSTPTAPVTPVLPALPSTTIIAPPVVQAGIVSPPASPQAPAAPKAPAAPAQPSSIVLNTSALQPIQFQVVDNAMRVVCNIDISVQTLPQALQALQRNKLLLPASLLQGLSSPGMAAGQIRGRR